MVAERPPPNVDQAVPPPSQGTQPRTSPPKRNNRHRRAPSESIQQIDGTVSDSVTTSLLSPRSRKAQKPRQQSVAIGALPHPASQPAKTHDNKQRPVSVGGNVLPATPLKEQAYAGPTFSASPAPSSLPVPKFFSKSVPNVAQRPLDARMAGDRTPERDESSPEPDVVSLPPRSQQSPLDFFFQADRAEKEKSRSPNSLSPGTAARMRPATQPRYHATQSNNGAFLADLDGSDSDRLSPDPLPANNGAAPVQRPVSDSSAPVPNSESELTRSLKNVLLNGNGTFGQTATPLSQQRGYSNLKAPETAFETPSPFQRSVSGPSTPTPSAAQQYSLHYGNRDLSPLFRAARSETPPRPSGLRQELANDTTIGLQPTRPIPQIDPNSFSREYLDRTIRSSQPTQFQQQPYPNITQNRTPPPNSVPYQTHPHDVQGNAPGANGASPRASAGAPLDIQRGENALRQVLNLNVLSN